MTDLLVAATAHVHGAVLYTRNADDCTHDVELDQPDVVVHALDWANARARS